MLLTQIEKGNRVRIVKFYGGEGFEYKLRQMGLSKGECMYMVRKAPIGGPIIVEVKGRFIAIGRGIANKIEVEKYPCE